MHTHTSRVRSQGCALWLASQNGNRAREVLNRKVVVLFLLLHNYYYICKTKLQLTFDQISIHSTKSKEVVVAAEFHDGPSLHHCYQVGVDDCTQSDISINI